MEAFTYWSTQISGSGQPNRWTSSNRALHHLIARHRCELSEAAVFARRIKVRLQGIFPILEALCRASCPWCPEPCCIVNRVWFDFPDLLFMHLNHLPLPPAQVISRSGEACRYLAHHGCRLPRILRPWTCTQYVCATQTKMLNKVYPGMRPTLERGLGAIKCDRLDMEDRFVQTVVSARDRRRAHRTDSMPLPVTGGTHSAGHAPSPGASGGCAGYRRG